MERIDLTAAVSARRDVQPAPHRGSLRLDQNQGFPPVPNPAAWPAGSVINVSPKGARARA